MRRGAMAGLMVAAMFLAACGGDDGDDAVADAPTTAEAADPSELAEADDPAPPDEPAEAQVGEFGSYTVDGTVFAVTSLNRCEPFFDGPDDLDLQAIASGAILNLPVNGTELDVSVQGSAIEQEFGSISFGAGDTPPDFSVDGDRISGSATLEDVMGGGGTVDVTFDVAIPAEINEC